MSSIRLTVYKYSDPRHVDLVMVVYTSGPTVLINSQRRYLKRLVPWLEKINNILVAHDEFSLRREEREKGRERQNEKEREWEGEGGDRERERLITHGSLYLSIEQSNRFPSCYT